MLSAAVGVPPDAWRFETDGHGRPHVTAPLGRVGVPFSITHTRGLVACAVAGTGEVGIDAEARDRESRIMDVARRFFSDTEVACLERSPPSLRRDVFFHIWTLKEAYVKALGRGLTLPLSRFSFDLEAPPPQVPFHTELGEAPQEWAFALEHPTPRHCLAVAARTRPGSVLDVHLTPVTASALPGQ
jgi:4'-phosphopantetheinyl transferase